jgi:hypothetical protein
LSPFGPTSPELGPTQLPSASISNTPLTLTDRGVMSPTALVATFAKPAIKAYGTDPT